MWKNLGSTAGMPDSGNGCTPPEACCVSPFRAKISGTTHTGILRMVVRPPALAPNNLRPSDRGRCGLPGDSAENLKTVQGLVVRPP